MRPVLYRMADYFAVAGGIILAVIVLVTTTNVSAFILHRIVSTWGGGVSGLPGYEDFVRLAMSSAALMFFPYCQVKRGHVAVDIIMEHASKGVQRLFDRLWSAVAILLTGFLAWWMVIGMLESRSDAVIVGVLGWSEWPFYIPGILSLILWALVALAQFFDEPEGATHV